MAFIAGHISMLAVQGEFALGMVEVYGGKG